jgi:hypothetical protein
MTVRVPEAVIEYRNQVHEQNPRLKKKQFDTEVYEFYMKHHPLDAEPDEKESSP